jgi:CRP-like cAMP-binding protein
VVLTGRIRFSSYSADGKEVTMRDQQAGSLFGELAAIDGGRRSVSVVAQEDSSLLLVPGAAFRDALLADAASMAWFARHLVYQVRALTDRVFELSTMSVRARLHSQLLRLATAAGVSDNRALLEPAPTHEVLANMIGTHREAVTRELSWLSGDGVVKSGRLRLEVLDVARLAEMVRRSTGSA